MAAKNKLESFIENPRISLWKLTIPMMFGLFVNSIYILVDTYFVGSMLGEDGTSALSALGYVMPFYFIIIVLGQQCWVIRQDMDKMVI